MSTQKFVIILTPRSRRHQENLSTVVIRKIENDKFEITMNHYCFTYTSKEVADYLLTLQRSVDYTFYHIIDVICPNFPLCKINVLRGKRLLINMFDLWNKQLNIHEELNKNEGNLE
jgi:hypothetical protein